MSASNSPKSRGRRSTASAGSFLVVASEFLADAEGWAKEYWTRQQHYYDREAWREAAHYEDLAYAAEGRAQDIRRLMELSGLRQPKKNARITNGSGEKGEP